MKKIFCNRLAVAAGLGLWWFASTGTSAQNPAPSGSRPSETASSRSSVGISTEERFGTIARVRQFQKLVDDKEYEINTTIQTPSINGGERLERAIRERARKLDENHYTVERSVQNSDAEGRLQTVEVVNEEHTKQANHEETKRSTFRPDTNGKMHAQIVEQENVTAVSKSEKQIEKAVYRLDLDGKLSLSETEEGQEKRVNENVTVKETSRQAKAADGRMAKIGSVRETTTKTAETSFRKETIVQRAEDNGQLAVAEKVTETQAERPDGSRQYTRVLESRNLPLYARSVETRKLVLYQRVSGEERKLADGSVESTTKVETLDPANLADGLKVSQMITELARPLGDGKISVERVVKARDVNGNFVVSEKSDQIVEPAK